MNSTDQCKKRQTIPANYPPAFLEGLRLYWQGRYWHSHKSREKLWRQSDEPERSFLKALIQIDAALIHAEQVNWEGVRNLLTRVMGYLKRCPKKVLGVSVPSIKLQITAFLREVTAILQGNKGRLNWYLKLRLVPEGLEQSHRERLRRFLDDQ